MGRSVGFKCECGGWPKYQRSDKNTVILHCNACGWQSETNEEWNPAVHESVPYKPASQGIGWVILKIFVVLGYILVFGALGGIGGCTVGLFTGTKLVDPGALMGLLLGLWLGVRKARR